MVFISAVTPAPEEGSKPAMVRTTGGIKDILEIYLNRRRAETPGSFSIVHRTKTNLNQSVHAA
jgi:hypothetical protein